MSILTLLECARSNGQMRRAKQGRRDLFLYGFNACLPWQRAPTAMQESARRHRPRERTEAAIERLQCSGGCRPAGCGDRQGSLHSRPLAARAKCSEAELSQPAHRHAHQLAAFAVDRHVAGAA